VKDLQGALQHAAVIPAYQTYLQMKYQWTTTDAEEVNWNLLTIMLKHFPTDHNWIAKIIHKWLPLLGAYSTKPSNATLCLQCQQLHEDTWHFFECQAPARQTLFNQLHWDLQKLHKNTILILTSFNYYGKACYQSEWILTLMTNMQITQHHFRCCSKDSTKLDGNSSWAHHINSMTHGKTSRTIFYSQAIKIIWTYLLQVWVTWNAALHALTVSEFTTAQLKQQVDNLLNITKQDPATQHLVEDITSKQIMQQTPARIKQWILLQTSQIKVNIAAAQKHAKLHTTLDIRNFYSCKVTCNKNSLKPPWYVQPTSSVSLLHPISDS